MINLAKKFSNLNAAPSSGRCDNNSHCPAVFFEKSAGKTTFRHLEDGEIESTLKKSGESITKIFNGSPDNSCVQYYNAGVSDSDENCKKDGNQNE